MRGRRIIDGFPWRWIFTTIPTETDSGGITVTWAQGLLSNQKVTLTMNQPSVIETSVVPDDRRVNGLHTDGFPKVSQSNRIIYGFQREGPQGSETAPWQVRAAGIVMSPQDQGETDSALSHLVAYDAWKYMEARPCRTDLGAFPDPESGIQFLGSRGDEIATTLLRNSILADGFAFIDAGEANGGTAFYGGTIEETDPIIFSVQQGMMIGEAWSQLCETGNMDIILTPIYDPVNRPWYTHELNIYRFAGVERPAAVFAWDRLMRSVGTIDRSHDGTPGSFMNLVQFYAGQGGFPSPLQENVLSVNAFMSYFSQQFFPSQPVDNGDAIAALAQQALTLAKQGQRTMTLAPSPERSPVPLLEYGVGDRVPIYASRRLRVDASGYQRVQAIPIEIDDDGVAKVSGLLCTPDWRDQTT